MRLRTTRQDALPEPAEYRDTGCTVAPSCLRCPLPQCRYDVRGGARAMLRPERNEDIVDMYERRVPVDAIAERVGLGRRQVFRIVQEARK